MSVLYSRIEGTDLSMSNTVAHWIWIQLDLEFYGLSYLVFFMRAVKYCRLFTRAKLLSVLKYEIAVELLHVRLLVSILSSLFQNAQYENSTFREGLKCRTVDWSLVLERGIGDLVDACFKQDAIEVYQQKKIVGQYSLRWISRNYSWIKYRWNALV